MISLVILVAAIILIPLTIRLSTRAASGRRRAGGRLRWHGIQWDAAGDPDELVDEAIALQRKGDLAGALAIYDRAVALKRTPLALNNRACALLATGEIERAIADLKDAVTIDPASATAHCTLAEAYCRAGDAALALQSLQRAVAIDPVWREHAKTAPELEPVRASEEGKAWLDSA